MGQRAAVDFGHHGVKFFNIRISHRDRMLAADNREGADRVANIVPSMGVIAIPAREHQPAQEKRLPRHGAAPDDRRDVSAGRIHLLDAGQLGEASDRRREEVVAAQDDVPGMW